MILIVVCGRCRDNKSDNVTTTIADTRIRMQSSSEGYEGLDYKEVVSELKALGFTNINTKPLDDLIIGFIADENEVEEVSVGGSIDYSAGSMFYPDVRIVVSYHSYPEADETVPLDGKTTKKPTNEKSITEKTTKALKTTTTETEASEESTKKDKYAEGGYQLWAISSVKDYGKKMYPYGIEYHFGKRGSSIKYSGDSEWFIQVPVTITNEHDAQREYMIFALYNVETDKMITFDVVDY